MLTHLIICINNFLFFTQFKPSNSSNIFAYNTHRPFSVLSSKPGLFLTVPKQAVGCPWATLSPSIGSTLWNRNPWPFSAQQHPNHNLLHKLSHKPPKHSLNYPKWVSNIPTIQSQVLGQIKRPLTTSNQPNHSQGS